jgi:hypothetical protein
MEQASINTRIRDQLRTNLKQTTSCRSWIANLRMSSFRIFLFCETLIMVVGIAPGRAIRVMGDNSAMSASISADSDIELFREDLLSLKRDVASLIEHTKTGATNTVQDAAGQIKQRVWSLRQEAGAQGDRSAKAINLFIENQAVAALIIAVAIGYVGARVLRG